MANPTGASDVTPSGLLDFWFGENCHTLEGLEQQKGLWFAPNEASDQAIRKRFSMLPGLARDGALDGWKNDPRDCLALVIALDQLPRNLHRGSAEGFAYDSLALEVALDAIERDIHLVLQPFECVFLYLPFEHAEDRAAQNRSVQLFTELRDRVSDPFTEIYSGFLAYAERHQLVVNRFGRFPHRNSVLNRTSTPEELRYLATGGETFG